MPEEKALRGLARFCAEVCPVCRRARAKQRGVAFWFVKNVDRKVCPMCKAYERATGKLAYEP
jgi:RNA polymerase subunit RPABC4/transcription elongation factor Spt4